MKAFKIKIDTGNLRGKSSPASNVKVVELDTHGMKPKNPQTKLKWSKNKEFCPTCRGTGRIQEMVVDNIAKKALFFTDARCPDCSGSETATEKG